MKKEPSPTILTRDLHFASKALKTSKVLKDSSKRHSLVSIIYKGNKIISLATNTQKCHTFDMWDKRNACVSIHAEHGAIKSTSIIPSNSSLVVMRSNGKCSKPCKNCETLIQEFTNIKYVIFVDSQGRLTKQKSGDM